MKLRRIHFLFISAFFLLVIYYFFPANVFAETNNIYKDRFALYKKTEAITHIPWYFLAAVDQYERNQEIASEEEPLISMPFKDELWFGPGNLSKDQTISIVQFFNGIGQDGNGDGKADPNNPEDMLFTMALILGKNGLHDEDIKISLWHHYQRDLSVKTIMSTAKVLRHFKTNELTDRAFPVNTDYNYSYNNNWGDRRGFGGNRIHEGTDIFANYGTPVKSTTYGVIELKGWNLYGGWRIGIRDIYNIYHYYAHLQSYQDGIRVGDIVKPGDVLGTVGATGYGPPGTSGKFPPHLHYGMYKDNGRNEWSFDPYPYLRKWEVMEREK